jgi:hypothetical protein
MDSKKLVKVIKTIVEVEVAKRHEQFLTKTFPKILEEEVARRMNPTQTVVENTITEVDPFQQAELVLQEERTQPKRQFTKNEKLNEVLNNTKPFSAEQRKGTPTTKSVLDNFQQPVNESMDKTVAFNSQGAQGGADMMRAQMAQKMGYGDMPGAGGARQGGLGVQTGLAGLDKILNRDNSALVKKFKR